MTVPVKIALYIKFEINHIKHENEKFSIDKPCASVRVITLQYAMTAHIWFQLITTPPPPPHKPSIFFSPVCMLQNFDGFSVCV
jgi:hypothetical protein